MMDGAWNLFGGIYNKPALLYPPSVLAFNMYIFLYILFYPLSALERVSILFHVWAEHGLDQQASTARRCDHSW
jgi:hypothetical protein